MAERGGVSDPSRKRFADALKTVTCAHFIGIWTLGRLGSANLLRTRTVGPPGPLEIGPTISLAVGQSWRVNRPGGDAEGCQQVGQLLLGQRAAMLPFRPRPLQVGGKLHHEVRGANDFVVAKGHPNVLKEFDADGAV